jgi:hypothetical protein
MAQRSNHPLLHLVVHRQRVGVGEHSICAVGQNGNASESIMEQAQIAMALS